MKTLLILLACGATALITGFWIATKVMAFLIGAVPMAASFAKLAAVLICFSVSITVGLLVTGVVVALCGIVLTLAGALD